MSRVIYVYIQKGWSCASHNRFYGRIVCLASIRFSVKNSRKGSLSQCHLERRVSCGAFHFAGVGRILTLALPVLAEQSRAVREMGLQNQICNVCSHTRNG